MQPTLRKLKPGDPLNRLSSSTWNALVDNAQASRLLAGGGASWQGPGVVLVKNNSSVAIPRWGAIPITDPLFEIGDGGIEALENALQLASGDNIELNAGRVAIPLEEIAAGHLGRAMVYGTMLALISVAHDTDTRADLNGTGIVRIPVTGSGAFTANETVTQTVASVDVATYRYISAPSGLLVLSVLTGSPQAAGTFTGGTSSATRTFGTGAIQDERVYLRSGAAGEADIIWKEDGASDPEGSGTEENPLDLKWAVVHVGRKVRQKITAILTAANDYTLPDTTTTKVRYRYDWQEARLESDPASGNYMRYVPFSGGISTDAMPELRAINRCEAQYLLGTSHISGDIAMPVPAGTVVELKPERDSQGRTVWVFDWQTPQVLRGKITAVAGASGTPPHTASGITYTVRLLDYETSPSITGVRAYWGCPREEADKVVASAVDRFCLVAKMPVAGAMVWCALIDERIAAAAC